MIAVATSPNKISIVETTLSFAMKPEIKHLDQLVARAANYLSAKHLV